MDILTLDQNVLLWLNHNLVGRKAIVDKVILFGGIYMIYALPIVLLFLWFFVSKRQRIIAFSFAGMLIAWFVITKSIVPQIWFRPRPDLASIGAKELFFHRPDYSFPSDHATALFALMLGFYFFGYRRAGNWFLVYSLVIVTCRVALGIHFPLDILGGFASALIGAGLVKIFERPLDKAIWKPMSRFLKNIGLAR